MQFNPSHDADTLDHIGKEIAGWLPAMEYGLERDRFDRLTPKQVATLIYTGIVEPLQRAASDARDAA